MSLTSLLLNLISELRDKCWKNSWFMSPKLFSKHFENAISICYVYDLCKKQNKPVSVKGRFFPVFFVSLSGDLNLYAQTKSLLFRLCAEFCTRQAFFHP